MTSWHRLWLHNSEKYPLPWMQSCEILGRDWQIRQSCSTALKNMNELGPQQKKTSSLICSVVSPSFVSSLLFEYSKSALQSTACSLFLLSLKFSQNWLNQKFAVEEQRQRDHAHVLRDRSYAVLTWKPCLPLHQVVSSFGGMSITDTMSPTCRKQQERWKWMKKRGSGRFAFINSTRRVSNWCQRAL